MEKNFKKTKLIKQYFGDVIKEDGFEYFGADAWTWNFFRQKGKVRQEIAIMRHRFFSNQIKLIFFTRVYGWGDQEPCHFIEQYKNKEFWEYNSEEDFIAILQEFVKIIKEYGLEMLDKMSIPKDSIHPTPEMERTLFESYDSIIAEANVKYDFDKKGEEGMQNLINLLYQKKDEEFEDIKDFLVEMAALYAEIFINDLGGNLVLEEDRCFLKNIGKNKNTVIPLLHIVEEWKVCHKNKENEDSFLLIKYRQIKTIF